MYIGLNELVSPQDVYSVIKENPDRLKMSSWHGDSEWHNGHDAKAVHDCGTSHCIAGWAHHLCAIKRPELLSDKVNVELVGRLCLGDEAASHFHDGTDDAMKWIESQIEECDVA